MPSKVSKRDAYSSLYSYNRKEGSLVSVRMDPVTRFMGPSAYLGPG